MKGTLQHILYICIVLLFSNCEKELQFSNPDFEQKLVINGFENSDSLMKIGVGFSSSTLSEPSLNNVNGLGDLLVLKDGLLLYSGGIAIQNGEMTIPYKPLKGSYYEIQLAYGELSPIRAVDTVPQNTPVMLIDTVISQENRYRINLALDDGEEGDHYLLTLRYNGKELVENDSVDVSLPLTFESSEKIFLSNIRTVADGRYFAIFDDNGWNNTSRNIELLIGNKVAERPNFTPKEVVVELKNISKNMYDYYIDINNNTNVYGGPLASISRVTGNIDNGLGAFCFYTQTVRTKRLKP